MYFHQNKFQLESIKFPGHNHNPNYLIFSNVILKRHSEGDPQSLVWTTSLRLLRPNRMNRCICSKKHSPISSYHSKQTSPNNYITSIPIPGRSISLTRFGFGLRVSPSVRARALRRRRTRMRSRHARHTCCTSSQQRAKTGEADVSRRRAASSTEHSLPCRTDRTHFPLRLLPSTWATCTQGGFGQGTTRRDLVLQLGACRQQTGCSGKCPPHAIPTTGASKRCLVTPWKC